MSEYGPEVPVSRFCESLRAWAQVMKENGGTKNGMLSSGLGSGLTPELIFQMITTMTKSNLLYRLIYLGEPLRTEKCPKHDGHWSGCSWGGNPCDCQKVIIDGRVVYDTNVTGWLLEGNPPITGQCGSTGRVQADGSPLEYEPYDGYKSGRRAVTSDTDIWVTCKQLSGHKGACDDGHDWNPDAS